MSDKIHAAERFCRNILSSFPYAVEAANTLRENRSDYSDTWPSWCELPMSFVYQILTIDAVDSDDALQLIGEIGLEKIAELTVALIWMRYKVVYRFDNEFSKVLMGQPFDGDIPNVALDAMPYPCVFIENEIMLGDESSIGFYAWIEWDARETVRKLQFLFLLRSGETYQYILPVVGSLDDSLKALEASCALISKTPLCPPPYAAPELLINATSSILSKLYALSIFAVA